MKTKAVAKKGKPVSAKGANLLADLMKSKGKTPVKPVAAPIDAEDMADGGADEAKEKE